MTLFARAPRRRAAAAAATAALALALVAPAALAAPTAAPSGAAHADDADRPGAPAFGSGTTLPRPARWLGGPSRAALVPQPASVPGALPVAPDVAPTAEPGAEPEPLGPYELRLTPESEQIADYWYWAMGLAVTVEGLPGYYATTLVDHGPDGRSVVLGQGIAEPDGTLTVRVRQPDWDAALGVHTIEATNFQGYSGSTTVEVVRWDGWAETGTASPSRVDRERLQYEPVVSRGTGFEPGEPIDAVLFDPDENALPLYGARPLVARADGSFVYALKASSGGLTPGEYRVLMFGRRTGHAVDADFFLTVDGRDRRVGTVTFDTPRTTVSDLRGQSGTADAGVVYSITGVRPFALLDIFLRDAKGIDNYLGRGRADGEGRFRTSVAGAGAIAGRYQLRVFNTRTQDFTRGNLTVTEDDGTMPPQPTLTLSRPRLSRLDLMDPDRGVRIVGTGYIPGQVVELYVKDGYRRPMSTRPITTLVRHADADGTVRFHLVADRRPATGTWGVEVEGWLWNSVVQRSTLEVTR
ncbi:hypothetical protein [Nocardioides marinquilinus]